MSHAIRAAKDRASAGLAAAAAALPRDRSFRVLRVSQVDATELDTQLTSMLRLSLRQILDVIAVRKCPVFIGLVSNCACTAIDQRPL